ncbi:MAG: hypothetical protein LC655_04720, partial [Bacteroidales bacterium]|nr:hypothetical protein [Bacteroidales bacterium]
MKKLQVLPRFVFNIALLLSLPAFTIQLQAQHGWAVNPPDFAYSGQVTAVVSFDGTLVTSGTLGAFVDDECRGFADASYFPPKQWYKFEFLAYSNQSSGEILTFRYYNPDDGLIYEVNETLEFVADMRHNAMDPLMFTVTVENVNEAPVVQNPLDDLELDEGFGNETVALAGVFSDPDGDELTLSAVSSNTGAVTVAVTGSTLTITETGIGSSVITVTASDGEYTVDETFTVTVENVNEPPVVQ